MGNIKLLENNVINKIAAGEVIERPASVLKELIDNSIDSGADEISVFIQRAGKKLIKVIDNGSGMDEEDVFMSVERHATSKISKSEDLFHINTLGFRGEALASISAISRMTIKSKTADSVEGIKLIINGGKIVKQTTAGMNQGTEIEVANIFFNTPVRKKFMKTDTTEMSHLLKTVMNHSLAYPEIHFKFYSENRLTFESPKLNNRFESLINLYGLSMKNEFTQIRKSFDNITVEAYLGSPEIARKSRDRQKIFVNNRCIKNNSVSFAVYNSYKTLLGIGEHPVFAIFISVPPDSLDVNIHPTKNEVRFTNARYIQNNLEKIFKSVLQKSETITPKVKLKSMKISELNKSNNVADKDNADTDTFKFEQQTVKPVQQNLNLETSDESNTFDYKKSSNLQTDATQLQQDQFKAAESQATQLSNQVRQDQNKWATLLPDYKIIGQAHNLYIIVEFNDKLKLIDQHAAHERILYKKFMTKIKNQKIESQYLLMPVNLEVTQSEKIIINEWLDFLNNLGFELEEFGTNSYLIRSMPTFLGQRKEDKKMLLDLIDDIIDMGKITEYDTKLHNIVARMACRAAVKAGDKLMPSEMNDIIKALLLDDELKTCPHGRPTSTDITFNELEKIFKRK